MFQACQYQTASGDNFAPATEAPRPAEAWIRVYIFASIHAKGTPGKAALRPASVGCRVLGQAGFERELISERTRAGMASARRRGKHIGRPRKLSGQQVDHARKVIDSGEETRAAVAALFGVDVATLRRALREAGSARYG